MQAGGCQRDLQVVVQIVISQSAARSRQGRTFPCKNGSKHSMQ